MFEENDDPDLIDHQIKPRFRENNYKHKSSLANKSDAFDQEESKI